MRHDSARPQCRDEVLRVIALVGTQGGSLPDARRGEQIQGAVPLAGAIGMADVHADHQTMTVLHQAVGQVAQLRLLALALADQPGIRIRGGLVRLVAARLTAEIVAIALVVIVLGPEALCARPTPPAACRPPRGAHR
ncbi:hypothetical protein RHOFW104R3_18820 [Rhodanobacter denitrificans]|nr:hypothetical protein RHOFW104R3_18820 [Rhodanobacter denitrificans]